MQKKSSRHFITIALVLMFALIIGTPAKASEYEDTSSSGSPDYLYYIEGTGSYFLPGSDSEIFYSRGRWYRRLGESWSMSEDLEGPWSGVTANGLPQDLAELPADFTSTRKLGMIPYKYVVGPEKQEEEYYYRYYRDDYYDDYKRRGYRRQWNPQRKFWFYVAPDFHDDDWEDSHRRRWR